MRQTIGQLLAGLIVSGLLIAGGLLLLGQPTAGTDYVGPFVGKSLVGFGVLVLLITLAITAFLAEDLRRTRAAERLVVTPRTGEPTPPPAWGMRTIGMTGVDLPHGSAIASKAGDISPLLQGKGGVSIVSSASIAWDVPLVLGVLLVWTVVATLLFAPR